MWLQGQQAPPTTLTLAAGVYTPTLYNTSNIDASTAYECQYSRVGNVVTVSGKVDIDPTTTSVLTTLGMSVPIASNIASAEQCGGVGASRVGGAMEGWTIVGDATNDRVKFDAVVGGNTNRSVSFSFAYKII